MSHWGRALRMTCWNGPFWMAKFFRGNCTPSTVFISIPWFNGSQIGTWIEYENDSKSFEWFMISFFLFKMIDSISIYLYIFLSFLIIKEKEKENRIFTFFFFLDKKVDESVQRNWIEIRPGIDLFNHCGIGFGSTGFYWCINLITCWLEIVEGGLEASSNPI